ncbi:oxidoreductase [Vibrio japonicus]|uniref:Oxidoreductase n=2 Tax=Vibrio japonicus TaxID=1824638 RepID=A0ABY5LLW3_9VIBR|nr:oxidoreductase [Vibrio japonicus]UUM31838.1 oxidoreductase [Vibrio japonicus]
MLDEAPIELIYALSRQDLPFNHTKLQVIKDAKLEIKHWDEEALTPEYGFISLGTTKKQAGSNQALEKVDFELVSRVAQQMKVIGVKKLCVVSSLGASAHSPSHYLRCKGKMELALEQMGFDKLVFVRPGPLVGIRDNPRSDEQMVQSVLSVLKPLMIGSLANFIPIHASDVAKAMQYSLFQNGKQRVVILNSINMRALLKKYQ